MDLSAVVAFIKPERYVNLLLKRQQLTLDSKELKFCDARKMNGQRNPMTRDWRPSPQDSTCWLRLRNSNGWSHACGLTFVRS